MYIRRSWDQLTNSSDAMVQDFAISNTIQKAVGDRNCSLHHAELHRWCQEAFLQNCDGVKRHAVMRYAKVHEGCEVRVVVSAHDVVPIR